MVTPSQGDRADGAVVRPTVPLAQAAIELHLTREQALRRLMSGQLAGQRIDGLWLVDRVSLDAMLRQQAVE